MSVESLWACAIGEDDHDPRCGGDCGPCGGIGGIEATICLTCGGDGKCKGCSVGYRLRTVRQQLRDAEAEIARLWRVEAAAREAVKRADYGHNENTGASWFRVFEREFDALRAALPESEPFANAEARGVTHVGGLPLAQARARVTDEMVERARLAGGRWFAEHPDGASADGEWSDYHRAALRAALSVEVPTRTESKDAENPPRLADDVPGGPTTPNPTGDTE